MFDVADSKGLYGSSEAVGLYTHLGLPRNREMKISLDSLT